MGKKVAVVLFNQGEPDCLDSVRPYLFNMFYDPALLTVSNPFRWMMAKSISKQSAPKVRNIYREIDNKSPILSETEKQRLKLENSLNENSSDDYKCFTVMRYWAPFAKDIIDQVKEFSPDEIIIVPLYPQYSITKTGSGLIEWNKWAKKKSLDIPYRVIKDYSNETFFIDAIISKIKEKTNSISFKDYRLFFTAQGIPKKIIDAGDPYLNNVEITCSALINKMNETNLDSVICYKRQISPLEQIGPSLETEIEKAAKENKKIIIIPVTSLSETADTLVELDKNYKDIAEEYGIIDYIRINTIGDNDQFITGLANLVIESRG